MLASLPDGGRPCRPRRQPPILFLFSVLAFAAANEHPLVLGATISPTALAGKALKRLERSTEEESDHSASRLQSQASALFSSDQYEAAAVQYDKLCRLDPTNPGAWFGLGQSYQALSLQHLESLQAAAPQSVYGLLLTAENLFTEGQHRDAFQLYRQALKKDPNRPGIHRALSQIYRAAGHLDWAAVEEAREEKIPAPDCRAQPLACEFVAGGFQRVVAMAKAEPSQPSDYWLSRAYARLAAHTYQKLHHLPPSVELYRWKAGEYVNQGRRLEAIAQWKEALRLWPASREIKRELAFSLHLGRDYEAALPLFRQLLAGDPDSAELNLRCGDTLLFLQRPEQALSLLRTALRSDPTSLQALAATGLALAQMGQAKEAIPYLEQALPIDRRGSLHYQLAQAYRAAGRQAEAEATLRRYQEIHRSVARELELARDWMDRARITPP